MIFYHLDPPRSLSVLTSTLAGRERERESGEDFLARSGCGVHHVPPCSIGQNTAMGPHLKVKVAEKHSPQLARRFPAHEEGGA